MKRVGRLLLEIAWSSTIWWLGVAIATVFFAAGSLGLRDAFVRSCLLVAALGFAAAALGAGRGVIGIADPTKRGWLSVLPRLPDQAGGMLTLLGRALFVVPQLLISATILS